MAHHCRSDAVGHRLRQSHCMQLDKTLWLFISDTGTEKLDDIYV